MVVGRLDQISSHVVTFWVLSLAFWIQVFGDGHHWLLSSCCCTTGMWAVPTCSRHTFGVIPSHLDAQKHLDHHLHSAGNAFPLRSGRGLSHNHSLRTHGRLLELDIPKIEMGTAVVINNLWSIQNNTTANIDIGLTRCPFFLPTDLYLCISTFLPLVLSFMKTSQRWWAWWRNTRKTSASFTWTRTWDVFCDALAVRFTNTSQVLVCRDDADVFILLFTTPIASVTLSWNSMLVTGTARDA